MCSHEAQKLGDVHHGAQHRRRRKWDAALVTLLALLASSMVETQAGFQGAAWASTVPRPEPAWLRYLPTPVACAGGGRAGLVPVGVIALCADRGRITRSPDARPCVTWAS